MTQRKDKPKVIGEVFDEARIRLFLDLEAPAGINADYHVLEKAYRGMTVESFTSFVTFFLAQGRDINAPGPQGQTFLSELKTHRLAEAYVALLTANGAH